MIDVHLICLMWVLFSSLHTLNDATRTHSHCLICSTDICISVRKVSISVLQINVNLILVQLTHRNYVTLHRKDTTVEEPLCWFYAREKLFFFKSVAFVIHVISFVKYCKCYGLEKVPILPLNVTINQTYENKNHHGKC